jgi:NADH dehydrogenase FAD-containing subunit
MLNFTLIAQGKLGDNLSESGQSYLRKFMSGKITLVENSTVSKVAASGVDLADGRHLDADLCIWTAGFGVSPLARSAGLVVNSRGQIHTDAYLRSVSHPQIFAVGDAAETPAGLRMACATAIPMGAHTADNLTAELSGNALIPFGFNYALRCISLGRTAGLVQFVDIQDVPVDRIITGRSGAIVKELICRLTAVTMYAERYIPRFYRWPQPKQTLTTHPVTAV